MNMTSLEYYTQELKALEKVMETCGNSGMMTVFEARKKDLLELIRLEEEAS